ncbi:MAG TPA: hypothetical protein H9662_00390 [Firmicutes bacterium]|nr:hypothetical protein [Bacillota bacterium]
MKRVFISLLTAVFLLSFLPCAALEHYTDSFQSVLSSDIASYQGAYRIENGLFSSIGWNPPDSDGLLLTQNGSRACVTYQISGAGSVSFSFYTPFAPFAAPDVDHPQKYSIGYEHSSAVSGGVFQLGSASRLYYSPDTQEIFFSHAGQWHRVIYDLNDYCYRAQPASPSGSLVGLFCNLYTSTNGIDYQLADYRITTVRCAKQDGAAMSFCYQSAIASLPADTKYIRLELTGCGQVPDSNGGRLPYDQNLGVALAQVSFSGSNLMIGTPVTSDNSSSETQAQSNDSKKESSSSSQKTTSSASKTSSKTGSTPKYDGTGTIAQNRKDSSSISRQEQEHTEQVQDRENGSAIETQIGLPSEKRSANLGYLYMLLCILVIAGVCGYCLYRKKHPVPEKEEKQTPPKA